MSEEANPKMTWETKSEQVGEREQPYDRAPSHYKDILPTNAALEDYYRQQATIFQTEHDFSSFLEHMRTPLPTTFRLTTMHPLYSSIKNKFESFYKPMMMSLLGQDSVQRLPFCGDAWQIRTPRGLLRKDVNYKEFHTWITDAMEAGEVTRQEAVSMIPPLVLDVRRGMRVIDLCAAPGSKTSQLIELLHTSTITTSTFNSDESNDLGFVLANEMSRGRAYMLVHHIKRLQSPAFLVSSHDATLMPNVYPDTDAEGQSGKMYFDRVLADVPCSGDGTLRKNMAIWKEWTVNQAYGLHPLQARLLERAVRMIDPVRGGRVVYSTCSVNPIENEAVVQGVLMREQQCELVEVKLPGLLTRPGVKSWKVITQDGRVLDTADQVPRNLQKKIPSSVFPVKESGIPLERCLRVLPQDQDTGAFFVAVIDVRPRESGGTRVGEEIKKASLVKKAKYEGQEDPFRLLSKDFMSPILAFYGIDPEHPSLHFLTRTERGGEVDVPKTIQLVTKSIADLYKEDPRTSPANALRVVNVGIRCFDYFDGVVPEDLECRYRLNMEAINTVARLATRRILTCSKQDLIKLLSGEHVRREELETRVDGLSVGGAIFEVGEAGIRVPVWISERAVKAFVSKIERPALFAHLQ